MGEVGDIIYLAIAIIIVNVVFIAFGCALFKIVKKVWNLVICDSNDQIDNDDGDGQR